MYGEIGNKFGVGASTTCKKVNTAGTDESLFRLASVPEYHVWSQCPCRGTVPKFVLGHQQKAMLRLVPVPGTKSEQGNNMMYTETHLNSNHREHFDRKIDNNRTEPSCKKLGSFILLILRPFRRENRILFLFT